MRGHDVTSGWDRFLVGGAALVAVFYIADATKSFASGQLFAGTKEGLFALMFTYFGVSTFYGIESKNHPVNVAGRGICVAVLIIFVLSLLRGPLLF